MSNEDEQQPAVKTEYTTPFSALSGIGSVQEEKTQPPPLETAIEDSAPAPENKTQFLSALKSDGLVMASGLIILFPTVFWLFLIISVIIRKRFGLDAIIGSAPGFLQILVFAVAPVISMALAAWALFKIREDGGRRKNPAIIILALGVLMIFGLVLSLL